MTPTPGAAAAAYTGSSVVSDLMLGRWAQRTRFGRLLAAVTLLDALALLFLLAAVSTRAQPAGVLALSVALGLLLPPATMVTRSRWSGLLPDGSALERAFFLESALDESVFIAGPLLITVVGAATTPETALLVAGIVTTVGGLGLATVPPSGQNRVRADHLEVAPRSLVPARLYVGFIALGVGFSAIQVGVFASTRASGMPASAGIVLTFFSAVSLLASLVIGRRPIAAALRLGLLVLGTAVALPVLVMRSIGVATHAGSVARPGGLCRVTVGGDRIRPSRPDCGAGTADVDFRLVRAALTTGLALGSARGWCGGRAPRRTRSLVMTVLVAIGGAVGAPGTLAAAPTKPETPPMPLESPLLERELETEALETVLLDAVQGRSGRVVVIEGESGIGKTRLLHRLRSMAGEHGMAVLSARASLLEQSFGFGVVRQLLERAAREWDQVGSAAGAGALQVIDPFTVAAPQGSGELARLHSLYWLTADTCREPTVLLVDDAQWSDPESLRFLEYLRVRLDDLPVVLAMVGRSGEPGGLPELFRALEAHPDVLVLRPEPLQAAACRVLLEASLGRSVDPEFAQVCASVTGGNPLLLTMLAGSVARSGLEPSSRSLTRVARLGGEVFARQIGRRLDRIDRMFGASRRLWRRWETTHRPIWSPTLPAWTRSPWPRARRSWRSGVSSRCHPSLPGTSATGIRPRPRPSWP